MLDKRQIIGIATAFALALGLAACGSSDDDNNNGTPPGPPSSEIPASANTLAGFIAFLQSLASSDTSEPLAVGAFAPPTDDTGDPQAL